MLKLELDLLARPAAADVAIVIDVLRMTSTASQLFAQGLHKLVVVADIEQARLLAAQNKALLLGERGGKKLPGFDGGNSPLEHRDKNLSKQQAVLCTSNGSKATELAATTEHLLLGAIINAAAVAQKALQLAKDSILLICAGTNGQVSLDDVLGAACIARELLKLEPDLILSDSSKLALKVLDATPNLHAGLCEAKHGQLLQELGFAADIRFAAQLNKLNAVPERKQGQPLSFIRANL